MNQTFGVSSKGKNAYLRSVSMTIKDTLKQILYKDFLWSIFERTVVRPVISLRDQRQLFIDSPKRDRYYKELQRVAPDFSVRHGPFQGMKYPEYAAAGSTLFPKLLGSYEKELHPVIESILDKPYQKIVDVGCAEGYYAIGLARRFPEARIFAFDTNEEAQAICHAMARANKVDDRVTIQGTCTPEVLESFSGSELTLVIADCEGYEKKLFTDQNIKGLKNCDFLIEVHDCFDISISSYLESVFSNEGFRIKKISSVDDIAKAHGYHYEELEGIDLETKKAFLAEYRATIMEWFFVCNEGSHSGESRIVGKY